MFTLNNVAAFISDYICGMKAQLRYLYILHERQYIVTYGAVNRITYMVECTYILQCGWQETEGAEEGLTVRHGGKMEPQEVIMDLTKYE